MATGGWNSSNNNYSFRPQYGTSDNRGSLGRQQNRYQNGHTSNGSDNDRGWQQQRFKSNYPVNQHGYHSSQSSQLKAKDDETRAYVVNLQLKPVEMGIKAKNGRWENEFRGIGAFNHYFGLCASNVGFGYTLPDIWDGYYHITLAKFFSSLTHDRLEAVFKQFNPSLEDIPYIPDVTFRSSSIETSSGTSRKGDRKNIPFVVLPIDSSDEVTIFYEKVQLLLEKIEKEASPTDWYVTPVNKLHVTVRKYSKFQSDLSKIKVGKFPLEFRCSHLEIKQPREQATIRYKQSNKKYIWWNGVAEVDGRCSGCDASVMSEVWEGFCLACGKYESVIPLWFTEGTNMQHQLSK